jgi:hypothetical protein
MVVLAVLCTILAGCATPYKEFSLMGGVKAVQIDDHVFDVASYVNGFSSWQTAHDHLLRKAAEVSLQAGCTYFVAVRNNEQSFSQPTEHVTEGLSRTSSGALVYRTASGTRYDVVKPGMRNTIVCFNTKPNALLPGLVFNARYVMDSIQ